MSSSQSSQVHPEGTNPAKPFEHIDLNSRKWEAQESISSNPTLETFELTNTGDKTLPGHHSSEENTGCSRLEKNLSKKKRINMGSEEDPRDYDASRKHFQIGFIIAAVSGILMWLLMFIWVFHFNGGVTWGTNAGTEINLHIILMVFFVIYLQGHGALLFRLFPNRPKMQVKLLHAGIHLSTVIAMAIGLWSAIRSHDMKNSPNFYSIHSWIGLTAIILYYGQFLAGFSVFLLPFAPMRIRNLVIPYHKMLGPLIFICSCLAAGTGIMMKALGALGTRYANLPPDAMLINFAGFFLLIFALTVVTLVYEYRFRRRPRPEGEMLLAASERSQDQ